MWRLRALPYTSALFWLFTGGHWYPDFAGDPGVRFNILQFRPFCHDLRYCKLVLYCRLGPFILLHLLYFVRQQTILSIVIPSVVGFERSYFPQSSLTLLDMPAGQATSRKPLKIAKNSYIALELEADSYQMSFFTNFVQYILQRCLLRESLGLQIKTSGCVLFSKKSCTSPISDVFSKE